jgi:hypothetical protein
MGSRNALQPEIRGLGYCVKSRVSNIIELEVVLNGHREYLAEPMIEL